MCSDLLLNLRRVIGLNAAVPMVEAMVALVLVDQLLQHYAQCQLLPSDPVLQGSEIPKREPTPLEEAVLFSEH